MDTIAEKYQNFIDQLNCFATTLEYNGDPKVFDMLIVDIMDLSDNMRLNRTDAKKYISGSDEAVF